MAGIEAWFKRGLDLKASEKPHMEWAFEEEQRAALDLSREFGCDLREIGRPPQAPHDGFPKPGAGAESG